MDEQVSFWNEWNLKYRKLDKEVDGYMARQIQVAMDSLPKGRRGRVLEIGCGTGWLSAALCGFADVVGIDLSPEAIEEAKRRESGGQFFAGDVLALDLPGQFDLIVTADTMAHIPDHPAFIERVRNLLPVNGTLLLMTQNAFVWNRSSQLKAPGKGHFRKWPRLGELKQLLRPSFRIEKITSIVPQGDKGILRLLNSRYCAGVFRKIIGVQKQEELYEWALIGKELVIVATRRA